MYKLRYKSFSERSRKLIEQRNPGFRFYYVFASNQDGTGAKLLGIVRRTPRGQWSADPSVFPPRHGQPVRTRAEAATELVEAWKVRILECAP